MVVGCIPIHELSTDPRRGVHRTQVAMEAANRREKNPHLDGADVIRDLIAALMSADTKSELECWRLLLRLFSLMNRYREEGIFVPQPHRLLSLMDGRPEIKWLFQVCPFKFGLVLQDLLHSSSESIIFLSHF